MTCDEYEEQISALIDAELKEEEAELLFAHLSACPSCRQSLLSVLSLRSDLREADPLLAPKELDEKVLNARAARKHWLKDRVAVPASLWTRRISMRVPIAAAILLISIAGSIALSSLTRKNPVLPLEGRVEAVYITTLPPVDVQGYFP